MRALRCAVTQSDLWPFRKKRLRHTERQCGCMQTEKRSCEDIVRRWLSAGQWEKP